MKRKFFLLPLLALSPFASFAADEAEPQSFISGNQGKETCRMQFGFEDRLQREEKSYQESYEKDRARCDRSFFGKGECNQNLDSLHRSRLADVQFRQREVRVCVETFNDSKIQIAPALSRYCRDLSQYAHIGQSTRASYFSSCVSGYSGKPVVHQAAELCQSLSYSDPEGISGAERQRYWRNKNRCFETVIGARFDRVLIASCNNLDEFATTQCLETIKGRTSDGIDARELASCQSRRGAERVICLGMLARNNLDQTPATAEQSPPRRESCQISEDVAKLREEIAHLRGENQALNRMLERSSRLRSDRETKSMQELTSALEPPVSGDAR